MQDFISHKDQSHSKPVTEGWTPDVPSLRIGLMVGVLGVLIGMEYLDSRNVRLSLLKSLRWLRKQMLLLCLSFTRYYARMVPKAGLEPARA